MQGTVLLLHTEPARSIRGVRMFINTGGKLVPKDLKDLIWDTGGDWNVLLDPEHMFDHRDFDR